MNLSTPFTHTDLATCLQAYATASNDSFRLSSPLHSIDELNAIDAKLIKGTKSKTEKPSRVPDESVMFILQQAGSQLYAMGEILKAEQLLLAPVATLTRSIVEHSAQALYLCAGKNHMLRTVLANRELNQSLRAQAERGDFDGKIRNLWEQNELWLQPTLQQHSKDLPKKPSNLENLVKSFLPDICPVKVYKELHNFVHPNAGSAMLSGVQYAKRPELIWIEMVDLAKISIRALGTANNKFAELRQLKDTEDVLRAVNHMNTLSNEYESWLRFMQSSSR
ncbi:hypothetical protein [Corynebacterium camporealensis]